MSRLITYLQVKVIFCRAWLGPCYCEMANLVDLDSLDSSSEDEDIVEVDHNNYPRTEELQCM